MFSILRNNLILTKIIIFSESMPKIKVILSWTLFVEVSSYQRFKRFAWKRVFTISFADLNDLILESSYKVLPREVKIATLPWSARFTVFLRVDEFFDYFYFLSAMTSL